MAIEKNYFVFRGIDQANSLWLRERTTPAHRDYVRNHPTVKMIHGGPLYDGDLQIGTCLILGGDQIEDIQEWVKECPFYKAGLFALVSVEKWGWTYGR
jgi:uncharacterized protein